MPDDSSFIDKLRMNGIFTPGNMNPVGGPDLSAGQLNLNTVTQGMNAIQPFIQQAQDKKIRDQQNMMLFQKKLNDPNHNMYGANTPEYNAQLTQIGNSMNQPNQQVIGSPSGPNSLLQQWDARDFKEKADKENARRFDVAAKQKDTTAADKSALAWDKSANAWDDNSVNRMNTQIKDYLAKNPDMYVEKVPGGNTRLINRKTGQVHDTGMPSGLYTSLQQIDERGKIQSNLETQRQQGRMEVGNQRGQQQLGQIGARIQGQQSLQDDRQNTPLPGTQSKVDQANKANQLRNTRPDLAQFIEIDQDGRVQVAQPSDGSGWFGSGGPSLGQWSEINSILNGGSSSTNQNSGYVNQSPAASQGINTSPSSSSGKYKIGIE